MNFAAVLTLATLGAVLGDGEDSEKAPRMLWGEGGSWGSSMSIVGVDSGTGESSKKWCWKLNVVVGESKEGNAPSEAKDSAGEGGGRGGVAVVLVARSLIDVGAGERVPAGKENDAPGGDSWGGGRRGWAAACAKSIVGGRRTKFNG